jgi:hypothetical protein
MIPPEEINESPPDSEQIKTDEPQKEELPTNATDTEVSLQLGDIIGIEDPSDENTNNQQFFIKYVDSSKLKLVNIKTNDTIVLPIHQNKIIGDGTITGIRLLYRNQYPEYTKQNNLSTNDWLKIIFHDTLIIAQILNVEGDMIELRQYPDNTPLFINFNYHGIPEELGIAAIEMVQDPTIRKRLTTSSGQDSSLSEILSEDKEDHRKSMNRLIDATDKITFGNENSSTSESKPHKLFDMESLRVELVNDFLSKAGERNLNIINKTVDRIIQLTEEYTVVDEYGNIKGPKQLGFNYKPLIPFFKYFQTKLPWILPVVINKKIKMTEEATDTTNETNIYDWVRRMKQMEQSYRENPQVGAEFTNKYKTYVSDMNSQLVPFFQPDKNSSSVSLLNTQDIHTVTAGYDVNTTYSKDVTDKYDTLDFPALTTVYTTGLDPDPLVINSIITLPKPVIQFSRSVLKGTDQLVKSNLNMGSASYSGILKHVKLNEVVIDVNDISKVDHITLLNNSKVNHYILRNDNVNKGEVLDDKTKHENYVKFLNKMVPNLNDLLETMKSTSEGHLSLLSISKYLEPFLINENTITYTQSKLMKTFIQKEIAKYSENFRANQTAVKQIKDSQETPRLLNDFSLIQTLAISQRQEILNSYHIDDLKGRIFSNSELYLTFLGSDAGVLFFDSLSKESIGLLSDGFQTTIQEDLLNNPLSAEVASNACETIVIAKQYSKLEDLVNDNQTDKVYFDSAYDNTNYGFLGDYESERASKSESEFKHFLTQEIGEKLGITEPSAIEYLIQTLMSGRKLVLNGQYAKLIPNLGPSVSSKVSYYVRKNNKWSLDKSPNLSQLVMDADSMCNLQSSCVENSKNECVSTQSNKKELQAQLLKQMSDEFDKKYQMANDALRLRLAFDYSYSLSTLPLKLNIARNQKLKYNAEKYKFAISIQRERESNIALSSAMLLETSPFAGILKGILSNKDEFTRNQNIVEFTHKFTRPPQSTENMAYLYCKDSNLRLLPSCVYEVAMNYVEFLDNREHYNKSVIELIKLLKGKLSEDDENYIVDPNTGWRLYPAAYLSETHVELLLKDEEEPKEEEEELDTYSVDLEDDLNIITSNTIDWLCHAAHITNFKREQKEMAIKIVSDRASFKHNLLSKNLLFIILGAFLIAVQTSIPSIKTEKTFPGCESSFSGYPLEQVDTTNVSGLKYVSCIAVKSAEHHRKKLLWSAIRVKHNNKNTTKIMSEWDVQSLIRAEIEHFKKTAIVRNKINKKIRYNIINAQKQLKRPFKPEVGMLPPQVIIKLNGISNVSSEIRKDVSLRPEIIFVLKSKIRLFSLAIQETIQNVLNTHTSRLYADEYFDKQTTDTIRASDSVVADLSEHLNQLKTLVTASTLFDKPKLYPQTWNYSSDLSQMTIYTAFVHFCHFRTDVSLSEELNMFCGNKPTDITRKNTTLEIIQKMKVANPNFDKYNLDKLQRLLAHIGRQYMYNVFDTSIITVTVKEEESAEEPEEVDQHKKQEEEQELAIEARTNDKIIPFLYNITKSSGKEEATTDLFHFLYFQIPELINKISDFMETTDNTKQYRVQNLKNLLFFSPQGSKIGEDNLHKMAYFLRAAIDNIAGTYVNRIIKSYCYVTTSGLSFVNEYCSKLNPFYGMDDLKQLILSKIFKRCEYLLNLKNKAYCYSELKMKHLPICLLLNQYYFLKVMEMYILVFKEQHALTTDSKRELNKTELVDLLKTFLVMTEADKSEVFFKTFNKNHLGGLETEILEAENKRQRPNLSKRKLIFKYKEENERETSSGSSSDSDSDSGFYSSSDSDSDSDSDF